MPIFFAAIAVFLLATTIAGLIRISLGPLEPTLRTYQLSLRTQLAQAFLAWVITLSPGTSSVELVDGRLTVHLLDQALLSEQVAPASRGYAPKG